MSKASSKSQSKVVAPGHVGMASVISTEVFFFASLIAGGMILGGVLCFIYIPKMIKSRS